MLKNNALMNGTAGMQRMSALAFSNALTKRRLLTGGKYLLSGGVV